MSRITASSVGPIEIHNWIQTNQNQIQKHPAWHGNVKAEQAEALLKGGKPLTYLLRNGDKEQSFFITFIKEDGSIKHQHFSLEFDLKGWYYKNGQVQGEPTEIIAEDLNKLIPAMMHCETSRCNMCIPNTAA